jgi:hypothetical protein
MAVHPPSFIFLIFFSLSAMAKILSLRIPPTRATYLPSLLHSLLSLILKNGEYNQASSSKGPLPAHALMMILWRGPGGKSWLQGDLK